MKKILLIFLSFFFIQNTLACSCLENTSAQESFKRSNYIFIWKVSNISDIWFLNWNFSWIREKNITFEVDDVIKWDYQSKIKIKTAWDTAACWYEFEENKNYFVYTNWDLDNLEVSLCSRTSLLENAWEDIEIFKDILQENNNHNQDNNSNDDENLEIYVIILLSFILIFLAIAVFLTKKR